MAKRGAQREINHDNWDQEEEPEEAGVFKQATKDVLKGREIKKAKRRGVSGEDPEGVAKTPSLFKGFTGFTSTNPKPAAFSFNKGGSKPLAGLSNGGMAPFTLGTPGSSFAFGSASGTSTVTTTGTITTSTAEQKDSEQKETKTETGATNGSTTNKSKYLAQLKALNESVSKWISDHVSKNAHCILTPIFKDYERHLCQIELLNPDKKHASKTEVKAAGENTASKTEEAEKKEVKEESRSGKETNSSSEEKKSLRGESTSGFNFPASSVVQSMTSTSASLFGRDMKFTPSGPGFTFSSFAASNKALAENKPFSFAVAGSASSSAEPKNEEAEEEYQPPKPEVLEIKEDGAFFTKRCKLYYQKDGQWIDRGVGNLHLKPCEGKTQLLVRADTNLGNILLNIMLNSSIPISRQGKNNVSLMCAPNPPIDPKSTTNNPTGMLIKVKTSKDADELYEKMNESKK